MFRAKANSFMADEKSPLRDKSLRSEDSTKNNVDTLISRTAICFERKQIAFMADEKSPARISHRLF